MALVVISIDRDRGALPEHTDYHFTEWVKCSLGKKPVPAENPLKDIGMHAEVREISA
jgi:hypothetical protein